MTDMIVSGAGTSAANGTYAEYGTRDGKPRYRMTSAESSTGYFYIVYPGSGYTMWCISVRGEDSDTGQQCLIGARYYAQENVATPDLVVTWAIAQGTSPAPTVTATSSGTTHEAEATLSSLSYLRTKKT